MMTNFFARSGSLPRSMPTTFIVRIGSSGPSETSMWTRVGVSNESGSGAVRIRLGRWSERRRRSSSVLRRSAMCFPDGAMSSSATASLTVMTGRVSFSKNAR